MKTDSNYLSRQIFFYVTYLRKAPISALVGLMVISIYVVVALFAPMIAPYGEAQIVSNTPYLPPSAEFWLGTDQLGRDLLTRLLFGARNSLGIAFATSCLSFLIGGTLGMLSATSGGWIDELLSRAVDTLMSIPQLIFALILLSIFGSSVVSLILIIATLDSTRVFRVTRSVAMNVAVMDFVECARLRGEGRLRIITNEILPSIRSTLIAEFGLRFCFIFLIISALSFLGLGIQPPTADWGSMVRENAALITYGLATPLIPAAAIAVLAVSVNLVVDWLLREMGGNKNER